MTFLIELLMDDIKHVVTENQFENPDNSVNWEWISRTMGVFIQKTKSIIFELTILQL